MRLALADALYLRFVNTVNFLLVMPLLVEDACSDRLIASKLAGPKITDIGEVGPSGWATTANFHEA